VLTDSAGIVASRPLIVVEGPMRVIPKKGII
jgi:hypothetical protein